MKKNIIVFILGGLLGTVAGAGGMLIAFPYIFPPPEVNERVEAMAAESLLREARFREDAPGQDPAHWGKGGLKVYQGKDGNIILELQPDFVAGPGPNFWIYLNSKPDINQENDFYADSARRKIQKLKSFSGSQVYTIPQEQYDGAQAVTIWCETFGQYIASANIN